MGLWWQEPVAEHSGKVGEEEMRLRSHCLKFRKMVNENQIWAEDLPFMAPNGRCYFDHLKECTPACEYYTYT